MTRFLDGPAAGQILQLQRSPILLRVVCDPATKAWDALDFPKDTPRPRETIHVYRRVGEPGTVHVTMTDRSKSAFYALADYEYWHGHPHSFSFHQCAYWRAWATLNHYTPLPPRC